MLPELLANRKVSVYQDVVLDGQTVRAGRRDCEARWQAIAPHFPTSGAVLDIGSNFGWFGLKACASSPQLVVASVEADEDSATIQRHVLESHRHERIALLTRRASAAMACDFAAAGQQFQAMLCLSVLHWMRDHERFLRTIGTISQKIFVELPDLDEAGAGISSIRAEIGETGAYLRRLFPQRRCTLLAQTASHRDASRSREIWLAEQTGEPPHSSAALDVSALLRSSVSWPPQSWWHWQIDQVESKNLSEHRGMRLSLSPGGLTWSPGQGCSPTSMGQIKRQIAALPERQLLSRRDQIARRIRELGRRTLRRAPRGATIARWLGRQFGL